MRFSMGGLGVDNLCTVGGGVVRGDNREDTDIWFHGGGAREEEGWGEGVDVLAVGGFGLGGCWGGGGEDLRG